MDKVESFIEKLKNCKGVSNWFTDANLSSERLHDFWYGGAVIGFDYGDYTITIEAIGDVDCSVLVKGMITEDDEVWFTNRSDCGIGTNLYDYGINKDSEITFNLLEYETNPNVKCYLDFANGNNNWIEIIAYDNKNNVRLYNYNVFGLTDILEMDVQEIIDIALDYKDRMSN